MSASDFAPLRELARLHAENPSRRLTLFANDARLLRRILSEHAEQAEALADYERLHDKIGAALNPSGGVDLQCAPELIARLVREHAEMTHRLTPGTSGTLSTPPTEQDDGN